MGQANGEDLVLLLAPAAACGGSKGSEGCMFPLKLWGSGRLAHSAAMSGPEPALHSNSPGQIVSSVSERVHQAAPMVMEA